MLILNKKTIAKYCFLVYAFIMCAAKAVGLNRTNKAYYVAGAIAALLALVSIVLQKYNMG